MLARAILIFGLVLASLAQGDICVNLVGERPFYDPPLSFASRLEEELPTKDALEKKTQRLTGSSGPRILTLNDGAAYVLKGVNSGFEVAAYQIDQRLSLQAVPRTEWITIGAQRYSAQFFVSDRDGWKRVLTTGFDSETKPRPLPSDEIVILDALLGNIDRGYKYRTMDNYLTFLDPQGRTRTIAIDNGTTKHASLENWVSSYDGFETQSRENLSRLREIAQRNSTVLERLKRWTEEEIRQELGPDLDPETLKWLLQRRRDLLELGRP